MAVARSTKPLLKERDIYRNGTRITQYPITVTTYIDGYYSSNSANAVTYGISAVNDLGQESPVKTVALTDITIQLKSGVSLRRGLLEILPVILTNPASSGGNLTISNLSLKVGASESSVVAGPFELEPKAALQLETIAATTSDAPSTVAVLAGAQMLPSPGVEVRIYKTLSIGVTGSGTALEIYSDQLIRGADAKVRLKLNNLGTAQMEIVASENGGPSSQVKIFLKDEDGNILSTGNLNQRVGASIVDTGSHATARLNAGENIITEPITLRVPDSAPYNVVIEAIIQNTYYHYSKEDQVTGPGMRQTAAATISEVAYQAMAAVDKPVYTQGQPVVITGKALGTQGTVPDLRTTVVESGLSPSSGSPLPMPNVPVKLGISVKGFDRYYTAMTDNTGNFSFTFNPNANEAGTYSVWAVHPDINTRTVQASFTIAGLRIEPQAATIRMAANRSLDIPVKLTNTGDTAINNLQFTPETSAGITLRQAQGDNVMVSLSNQTAIAAGETANLTLRITTGASAIDTGYATMRISGQPSVVSGQQTPTTVTAQFDASITLVSALPVISASPSYIDIGMVRGNQKIETLTLTNTGEETLKNARIEGLSTTWMALAVNKAIGDIAPGGSTSIGIRFSPADTVAQGVYDDTIVIYSDNHIPFTYHIQVTVTSSATGSVLFDVMDELMERVNDANITIQSQTVMELIYTLKTGADGTVMLNDIPEGRYIFNISAPKRKPTSGTFSINPGMTATVPIAMEVTLVEVTWSVTPVVIEDRYEIKLNTTFETNVPTPVLVTEPAGSDSGRARYCIIAFDGVTHGIRSFSGGVRLCILAFDAGVR